MIPKIIHYVWLSGDEKPEMVKKCVASWRKAMPDYEIREWGMDDIKHIKSDFLSDALAARKWAFATDYLRFYIIYNYGGIYLDSDIYAYRSFDPLLQSDGFTSLEGSGILRTELKKAHLDWGLEAAAFGAVKGSPWIKGILDFYKDRRYIDTPEYRLSIIAPKVMWDNSTHFGLRKVMSFQCLEGNVKIYPHDVLSCIADTSLYNSDSSDYENFGEKNSMRIACHLCANSWGWKPPKSLKDKCKETIIALIGAENAVALKRSVKKIMGKKG